MRVTAYRLQPFAKSPFSKNSNTPLWLVCTTLSIKTPASTLSWSSADKTCTDIYRLCMTTSSDSVAFRLRTTCDKFVRQWRTVTRNGLCTETWSQQTFCSVGKATSRLRLRTSVWPEPFQFRLSLTRPMWWRNTTAHPNCFCKWVSTRFPLTCGQWAAFSQNWPLDNPFLGGSQKLLSCSRSSALWGLHLSRSGQPLQTTPSGKLWIKLSTSQSSWETTFLPTRLTTLA